ncbi:helix-turn-helix domain-containing protein [Cohnella sp. GCM10012308]|uniref:helix-turn-helix domain-containing protein n=1 Tax=Cohnella sp. GCM10012308 TaxID=3317329 RepID=UPI003606D15A
MKAQNAFSVMYEQLVAEVTERVTKDLEAKFVQSYQDRTLSSKETAEYLGISPQTLYTLCKQKQIRHIPAGSLTSKKPVFLFRQSVLDAWMRQREEESVR